jgi:hypothetical protein
LLTIVQIINGRPDVLHVGRDGVADHEHLKARDHEDHDPHPRVAKDLDELLDQHVFDALEHVSLFSPLPLGEGSESGICCYPASSRKRDTNSSTVLAVF